MIEIREVLLVCVFGLVALICVLAVYWLAAPSFTDADVQQSLAIGSDRIFTCAADTANPTDIA